MKTYLINDNCVYNEGKYELRTTSNSRVIKMTAMRAKCLSFIIENANMDIIERQKITAELWGSRSHFVNDANLGNASNLLIWCMMAVLRCSRGFHFPRQGIQVNKEMAIKAMESDKKGSKRQIFRKTLAALTTVFSVTLGTVMYLHIH